MPSYPLAAALCLAAVGALLACEYAGSATGRWLTKPIASAAFVVAGLSRDALATPYGRWVVAGLVLGALGDVLLIPRHAAAFRAGLGAFLLGHVAYAIAFAVRGIDPVPAGLALLGVALLAWRVRAALVPRVPSGLRAAVNAYIAVITAMVVAAAGTRDPLVTGGAVAFFCSDLAVARERFVAPGFVNRAWGLPLYYAAQLALAASV